MQWKIFPVPRSDGLKPQMLDIGVNLTSEMYRGMYSKQVHENDTHCVVERAQKSHLTHMIITGTDLQDSLEAILLAKQYNLHCTVGVHPTRCSEFDQYKDGPQSYLDSLLQLIHDNPSHVVAVGETGLDYDRTHFCPVETQKKYFEAQFELAQKTQLPMFLHNRNTGSDFVDMVRQHRSKFTTGVVHSFTGTKAEAFQIVNDLDLYIGINGCSLKSQENLDVVSQLPLDKIMIETDAPWCDIRPSHASFKYLSGTVSPLEGVSSFKKERFQMGHMVKGRNEPCTIWQVAEVIAGVKSVDVQVIVDQVYKNTLNVFFPNQIHST